MNGPTARVGTFTWVQRTGGQLSPDERRSLLRLLMAAHATNAVGRLSMLVRLNSGRRTLPLPAAVLAAPTSALTRAAEAPAPLLTWSVFAPGGCRRTCSPRSCCSVRGSDSSASSPPPSASRRAGFRAGG